MALPSEAVIDTGVDVRELGHALFCISSGFVTSTFYSKAWHLAGHFPLTERCTSYPLVTAWPASKMTHFSQMQDQQTVWSLHTVHS